MDDRIEKSPASRTAWMVIVCLLLLIGAVSCIVCLVAMLRSDADQAARNQRLLEGRLLVDQFLLAKHWREMDVGAGGGSGKGGTTVNSGRFVDTLTKSFSRQPHTATIIRPEAQSGPGAPRDDFERDLCDRFLKSKPGASGSGAVEYADRVVPGSGEYQYYQAVRAQASCMQVCHGPVPGADVPGIPGVAAPPASATPREEGDLMAIIRITLPLRPPPPE